MENEQNKRMELDADQLDEVAGGSDADVDVSQTIKTMTQKVSCPYCGRKIAFVRIFSHKASCPQNPKNAQGTP